jgi:hypothetical protein
MTRSKAVDRRTDIWSIGAVLYELVTGKVPFRGDTLPEIVSQVLQNHPEPPSHLATDLPPWVDDVVKRCLEKHPENRFLTIEDFAAALRAGGDPGKIAILAPRAASGNVSSGDLAVATTKRQGTSDTDVSTASTEEVEVTPRTRLDTATAATARGRSETGKRRSAKTGKPTGTAAAITLESATKAELEAGALASSDLATSTLAESTWGKTSAEQRALRASSKTRLIAGVGLAIAALGVGGSMAAARSLRGNGDFLAGRRSTCDGR